MTWLRFWVKRSKFKVTPSRRRRTALTLPSSATFSSVFLRSYYNRKWTVLWLTDWQNTATSNFLLQFKTYVFNSSIHDENVFTQRKYSAWWTALQMLLFCPQGTPGDEVFRPRNPGGKSWWMGLASLMVTVFHVQWAVAHCYIDASSAVVSLGPTLSCFRAYHLSMDASMTHCSILMWRQMYRWTFKLCKVMRQHIWGKAANFIPPFFCSSSQIAAVKELLKSVRVRQNHLKKTALVFFDSRCTFSWLCCCSNLCRLHLLLIRISPWIVRTIHNLMPWPRGQNCWPWHLRR